MLRNPNLRPAMEADFKRMLTLIEEAKQMQDSSGPDEPPPPPKQLSLF